MRVLITGGAGFIGTNLAVRLVESGRDVVVYDDLSRPGTEANLEWLRRRFPRLGFAAGDVRDARELARALSGCDVVYHLAAQVAVTRSVDDPRADFAINAGGSLNLLEAARAGTRPPIVVYMSTNKVYGNLPEVAVRETATRYELVDRAGIDEATPLDFHSPYGCSKGAADQYVRDYARIYGLQTVVLRASCIYGPHQNGSEDQGWVAHFLRATAAGKPIVIYGNGKQVRDLLWIDDLVRALILAVERIDVTSGQVYNIGGGPANTLSIWLELGPILEDLAGRRPAVSFAAFRPGDQLIYVSDTGKLERELGWKPQVEMRDGIERLHAWLAAPKGFAKE